MKERAIPQAAREDGQAVEMLRVWIAGNQVHCSIKQGLDAAAIGLAETGVWGMILADVARQLATQIAADGSDASPDAVLGALVGQFIAGLQAAPPEADGTGGTDA